MECPKSRQSILYHLQANSLHKSSEMLCAVGRRLKAGWKSLDVDMKMLHLMFKCYILPRRCLSYAKDSTLTLKQRFRACRHFIGDLPEYCRIWGLHVFGILGSHYRSRHSQSFAACGTDSNDTHYMHFHCHCHPGDHAGNMVRTTSPLSHWPRWFTCIQFITKR